MALSLQAIGVVHSLDTPIKSSIFTKLRKYDKLLFSIELAGNRVGTPPFNITITNLQTKEVLKTGWVLASRYIWRYQIKSLKVSLFKEETDVIKLSKEEILEVYDKAMAEGTKFKEELDNRIFAKEHGLVVPKHVDNQ